MKYVFVLNSNHKMEKIFNIRLFLSLAIQMAIVGILTGQKPGFYLKTDRPTIREGETFVLEATLENIDSDIVTMPDLSPFKVINGPATSTSISIINGNKTSSKSYRYTLLASQKGKFTIPPATTKIGTKTLSSNSIEIEIRDADHNAKMENLTDDIALKIEISSEKGYIGQQLVLDYVIYTTTSISSFNFLNEPDPDGFYIESMKDIKDSAQKRIINGKEYYTQVIGRKILYPQKTGSYTLGPINMSVAIPVDNGRHSFFLRETKAKNLTSNSLKVNILPLPEPQPQDFCGAVGKIDVRSAIQKTTVTTGDAIVVQTEIKGYSDPKTMKAPIYDLPEGLEAYEPSLIEENTVPQNGQFLVTKIYEYIFVPHKDTIFTIQPSVSYFSQESQKYESINADPFTIRVVKSEGYSNGNEKQSKTSDLIFSNNLSLTSLNPDYNPRFITISGVFSVLFITLIGIFIKKKKINNLASENLLANKAETIAKQHLSKAHKFLTDNNPSLFYEEIANATTGFVIKKFNIPHSESSVNSIVNWLKSHDLPKEVIEKYEWIHKQSEMARFAGSFGDLHEAYSTAEQLIKDLES